MHPFKTTATKPETQEKDREINDTWKSGRSHGLDGSFWPTKSRGFQPN